LQKNADEDVVELYAVVEGHVQGVGLRYRIQQIARGLDLSGWVRNRPEGTVELICQGKREHLEKFLLLLDNVGFPVHITARQSQWRPIVHPVSGFSIAS